MKSVLHRAARVTAYLIAFLLALVWTAAAAVSLTHPLFDIGQPHVGDTIVTIGRLLAFSPAMVVAFAHMLAGLKLFIGIYLFVTVIVAGWDWAVHGTSDDAMLDVGLLMSALASLIAALPVAGLGGEPLQAVIGELMLAAIASAAAIYGRGFVISDEMPRLKRPEPVVIAA
ncbi:MAG: hypothetical protein QOG38_470 [Hyphomicrobiales bacterium]|jgi:hypothetical protein|nr:hypothetical protein [Hyphomicrobiales bacterium]